MRRDYFLELIEKAKSEERDFLFEHESKSLLKKYDIPTTDFFFIKNENDLSNILKEIRYPCVVKIVSRDAIHKSDIGGVIVGIKDEKELFHSLQIISKIAEEKGIRLNGFLIEDQAKPGIEVIIGSIKDKVFGDVLMFGLGGIYTEAFKDVNFLILPATKKDFQDLVINTNIGRIITKSRGKQISLNKIIELLERVSYLIEENPEILEMDLNPVILNQDEVKVLDARIRFKM